MGGNRKLKTFDRICPICNNRFTTHGPGKKKCLACEPPIKLEPKTEKYCVVCGKQFFTRFKKKGFCSYKCHRTRRNIDIGYMSAYKKEYFCEKYFFTCQSCNSLYFIDFLHVHHITPLYKGGENTEDNMTILCIQCHRKEHKLIAAHHNIDPKDLI